MPREDVESILVPTAGGPHAPFAAEIARAIARPNDAHVEVLSVITPEADDEEARSNVDTVVADLDDVHASTAVVEGNDVAATIVERSADHDVTIIGASREGLLQQLVFGAIPEDVGRQAKGTVIMAKRNLGITSRLTRWVRNQRS